MHQRGRFLPARRVEIGRPGEAQLADVLVVDLIERGEPGFGPVIAIGQPLARRGLGNQRIRHALGRRSGYLVPTCGQRQQRGKRQQFQSHSSPLLMPVL